MNREPFIIQEIVQIPYDMDFDANKIAAFIDSEIALERIDKNGGSVKVDSVSIVYGEGGSQVKFPFVHSGKEFYDFLRRMEKFYRLR